MRLSALKLRCRQRDRRGTLYLAVIGVAMIVSAIGMSVMAVARLNLRSTTWRQDRREARLLADSAIELGIGVVNHDPNWRNTFNHNQENPSTPMALGHGTIAWKLVDADWNLANDSSDAVRLCGIGKVGQSVYTKSALLLPSGAGLDSLTSALHAQGALWINNNTDVITATGAPVSTNDQAKNWGTINADLQCNGTTGPGTLNGTLTDPLVPSKSMPGSSVWDYYLNNGTYINYLALPSGRIEREVLSATHNPFGLGLTNAEGIYIIDCMGNDLEILDSRIEATLVLLNPGSGVSVQKDIHWEPAVRNYPALMVEGDIEFNWHGDHNLRESQLGVNFNPPHTPFQGSSDADQIDEYAPLIKGLLYIEGTLTVSDDCFLEGSVVIGGELEMSDVTINLTYDSTHLDNPPPGFADDSQMEISPGSWQREVSQ